MCFRQGITQATNCPLLMIYNEKPPFRRFIAYFFLTAAFTGAFFFTFFKAESMAFFNSS